MKMAESPNPVDRHVGIRVRMRRQELGVSQSHLSGKLGITFQQVQKYEKGTNRIGSSRLQHIANILNVPVSFFFEDAPGQFKASGKAPSSAFVDEFLADDDGRALVRAFVRIRNDKVRHTIVELVKHIAERP